MEQQDTPETPAPAPAPAPVAHDPYAIHSIEQIMTLFDGGDFLIQFMADHRKLLQDLQEHRENFGHKSAKGSFTLTIAYELGSAGDLGMSASADFKAPKKPGARAAAYVDDQGKLTLHSPLLRRMHGGVRDAFSIDPTSGEVRDA